MQVTEKMVEALLTVRYPGEWPDDPVFQKLDADGFTRTFGDACRREARNELEAAFAVAGRASLSEYTDAEISIENHYRMMAKLGDPSECVSMPAADKESEVMPPGTRAETPTAREAATSPGVTAGASGLEPLDEIDSIASAELQQRADAALGDKSRWKIIDRAPSPDEVERVSGKRLDDLARIANAIPDSDLSFMHVHRNELLMMLAELRIKRIAAMNRAPQPTSEITDAHAAAIRAVPPQQEEGE